MEYTLATLKKPKSGDWYVYFSYRSPDTGKLHPFKIRGDLNRIKDKKRKEFEGRTMASETNNMLKGGWSPYLQEQKNPFAGKPLLQVLEEIYIIKKPSLRHRSAQHYRHALDLITEFVGDNSYEPGQFTPALAQGYSDYLMGKGYTAGTHNNQLSNMRIFFNAMVDRDIIIKNPFKNVRNKPTEEGKLISYSITQKQQIKSFAKENDHPMYMFIQWIYYCFIRPNELMQLKVGNIDFENSTIIIPASAAKNRKNGIVPISERFMPLIREKYERLEKEMFLFGLGLSPSLTGVHRNRASQSHKEMLKKIGVSNDHKLYDWKNTGGRDFILAGNNPYSLMTMMRHHSLDQTMVYIRSLGLAMGIKTNPDAWEF